MSLALILLESLDFPDLLKVYVLLLDLPQRVRGAFLLSILCLLHISLFCLEL